MVWTRKVKTLLTIVLLSFIQLSIILYGNTLLPENRYISYLGRSANKVLHTEWRTNSSQLLNVPKYKESANSRPIEAKNFDVKYESICKGDWQYNYRKIHQNNLQTSKKFLVFVCPKAGWANRLRALLSSFHLAVMAKRAFIIDCLDPSPLEKYLAPNFISWNYLINTKGLSVRFRSTRSDKFCNGWKNSDFEKCLNKSVERVISNQGFYNPLKMNPMYNLPRWENEEQLLGCSFHYLFKKSEYLNTRLKKEREFLGFDKNIVLGIHIRRGDVEFPNNKIDVRLAKVEDAQHHFDCAEKIDKRIQEKYKTAKVIWFLATDSVEIKNYSKSKYPEKIKQLYGPIEHVGHPRKGNEDAGHLSMFLDYFLLQQSDFRLFTGHSSFSFAISLLTLGNYDVGLSHFKTGDKGKISCKFPPSLRINSHDRLQ